MGRSKQRFKSFIKFVGQMESFRYENVLYTTSNFVEYLHGMEREEAEVKHRHFKLHKPDGYISQFIDVNQPKIKKLGELFDFPEGTMSIGRLDMDSEGLLLLTTDGQVSYHVTSSKKVEKEYYVQVDGDITEEAIKVMEMGVEISTRQIIYKTNPCTCHILDAPPNILPRNKRIRSDRHGPSSWISITIKEGKFRQVRKMTAVVGFPTLRLIRVRIGNVHLGEMVAGEVEEVEKFDL